ncbi:uncharacterized protein LOC122042278 [Zingiber officinale]|uniref:uncharacterized protein LOC122042278 n=1 Tax=Zingiber officinale TaxID=94328 RepID=UPI001C4D424A|nr:uncharacterized protein LOC122042278 [Zingiber officinale]
MTKFVKFLKGILSNRRQKGDFETVTLTENCNALLMANSPPKFQDPGSFFIPCKIGSELIPRAFCDLGASVSLLPYPMGIVEDVPVEVGGCIVPTDFVILDMEEDPKNPWKTIPWHSWSHHRCKKSQDVHSPHELAMSVFMGVEAMEKPK